MMAVGHSDQAEKSQQLCREESTFHLLFIQREKKKLPIKVNNFKKQWIWHHSVIASRSFFLLMNDQSSIIDYDSKITLNWANEKNMEV